MELPLYSVLIANYNRGSFVREAIESVLGQTYSNIELVIVDDGSTDNSLRVLREFAQKDPRVRLFESLSNQGCGAAMRKCADEARGNYFCYTGSDDVLVPEAVAILLDGHQQNPLCGLVYSTHYVCDERLNVQRLAYGAMKIPEGESYLSYGKGITGIASFARTYYERTTGVSADFKRAVDQDIYYKMEEVGPVVFVDKPTCYYRVNPQGISTQRNISKARYWFVLAKEAAYRRRLSHPSVRNVAQKEIDAWWSILYVSKSSEAFMQFRICKGFYWIIKSLNKSVFDKYYGVKLKSFFLNSFIHRLYQRF